MQHLFTAQTAQEKRKYVKKRRLVSLISILFIVLLFILISCTIGKQLLDWLAKPDVFRHWIEQQGIWGKVAMIGLMMVQVIVAIMPGEVIEIAAGYAFGIYEGMILCLIGAAIGSTIIYSFTKIWGIKLTEAFISQEKLNSLQFLKNTKKLSLLIFIIFFIPGTPKDIITYFIGLTNMKLPTFLIISSVARIPSVITSTVGGAALGLQDYQFAAIVFAITGGISGIGLYIYHRICGSKTNLRDRKKKG